MCLAQKYRAVFPYFICVCTWKHAFYCVFKEQMSGQCLKHITWVLKNVFSAYKKKKKIHDNEVNLSLCIFKEYFNCWGTSQLLPFKYCPRSAKEGQTWTNNFFCRLTKTAIYVRFSRIETPLELQGSTLRSHWLSKQHMREAVTDTFTLKT